MPRFVLLRHECPREYKPSHWDLMLEIDGMLATWELSELPAAWAAALKLDQGENNSTRVATRLSDHRLTYLDYEGPVSGNRGAVTQVASGTFEVHESRLNYLSVSLSGDTLNGTVELRRINCADGWELSGSVLF